jgi:hypothetical protein
MQRKMSVRMKKRYNVHTVTCAQRQTQSQHVLVFPHSERSIMVYLPSEGSDVIDGNVCVVFRKTGNVAS